MGRKEMLYAVRSAAALAKSNLVAATKDAKAKFAAASNKEAAAAAKNAAARAALAGKIAADKKFAARALKDAVGGLTRSLLALKTETSKKIKKTNSKVGAYADRLAAQAKAVDPAMKANVASLSSKIAAARASVKAATGAANAASAARFGAVLKEVGAAMTAGKTADTNLKAAVVTINDKIAKQAALADSRFSKTVKDISAARKEAASEVAQARKSFSTSLAAVTAAVKDQETRLSGEIQVVSGEVLSHKASQIRVNRHTQAELKRITKLANARHSESVRARGKLRAQAAANSLAAARDLSAASKGMYEKLARNQLEMTAANNANAAAIASYSSKAAAATATAKANMNGAMGNLANTVASNQKHVEKGLEVLTGVVRSYKAAGKADRALIRAQTKAIGQDLNERIVRAIQIGEAKARRVANRARVNLAATKKALLIEISERVEATADKLSKTIQGNHKTIADNYLSFKAYAVTASSKITQYVIKGKGKNLSSLGDLLVNVAAMSSD